MTNQADHDAIIDLTDEVERLQKLNEKLTIAIRWWVKRTHALEAWKEDVINFYPDLEEMEVKEGETSTCIVGGHAPTCRCHEGGPRVWEKQG